MRWKDKKLLKSYVRMNRCDNCNRLVMCCGAHIISKGSGGGDFPANICSLGIDAVRSCECHLRSHSGQSPTTDDLLAISAARHECTPDDILAVVTDLEDLQAAIEADLTPSERRLAESQLVQRWHLRDSK